LSPLNVVYNVWRWLRSYTKPQCQACLKAFILATCQRTCTTDISMSHWLSCCLAWQTNSWGSTATTPASDPDICDTSTEPAPGIAVGLYQAKKQGVHAIFRQYNLVLIRCSLGQFLSSQDTASQPADNDNRERKEIEVNGDS